MKVVKTRCLIVQIKLRIRFLMKIDSNIDHD